MFFEGLLKRKGILMVMLGIAMLCGISPGNALAMPIDSQITVHSSSQNMHMEKIQSFFNRSVVQNKLAKLGLSKESAMQYVSLMNESQIMALSERIDTVDAASGSGMVVLLIILLLVVCVLYFTDYGLKLEPRRKSKRK